MKQCDMWALTARQETNSEERPATGWKVFEPTPMGHRPVISKRGKAIKYKELEALLIWIKENRPGYVVAVEGLNFTGKLSPTN